MDCPRRAAAASSHSRGGAATPSERPSILATLDHGSSLRTASVRSVPPQVRRGGAARGADARGGPASAHHEFPRDLALREPPVAGDGVRALVARRPSAERAREVRTTPPADADARATPETRVRVAGVVRGPSARAEMSLFDAWTLLVMASPRPRLRERCASRPRRRRDPPAWTIHVAAAASTRLCVLRRSPRRRRSATRRPRLRRIRRCCRPCRR